MCGRYVTPDEAALERFWTLDRRNWNPLRGSFNAAPASIVPIVRRASDGASELLPARWGLVPHWWSKAKLPTLTFNARSEEVAGKSMWRESYRHTRCLMPARGWYEWQAPVPEPGAGKRRPPKQPYYVYSDASPVIAFAGLMAVWRTPDDQRLVSCAVLTRPAAPALAHIHQRMPVVLARQTYAAWLAPGTSVEELGALVAAAKEDFASDPVSASATVPDAVMESSR